MILSPCKECPNTGCGAYHDECEKYLEYKKISNEARISLCRDENRLWESTKTYKRRFPTNYRHVYSRGDKKK